jgi:LCP family protein required for cell wall assembly
LLLVIAAAALTGIYHGLVRKPQLTENASSPAASSPAQSAQASASSEPQKVDVRKPDFYTILISGADDGNGGSDTNILVAFDAGNGVIHCVSIPRDTGAVINGKERKINYAYNLGGTEKLADTVSGLLGIPVDFTVEVKLKGFAALVDAIGGVDFDVPINMNYDDPKQDLSIHFSKGMQHLTGAEALEVVRFRHNNDGSGYGSEDLGRIATQQAFLKAVARQTLTLLNVDKISQFSKIFQKYVTTNLTVGNLAWLGKEAISIGTDNISFSTLEGKWKSPYYRLDAEAVLTLVNSSLNPYTADRTAEDLNIPS